ncbi:MAG: NUDIX domain-containing protein [Planctomycetota bacterium]|nr:NUDIX domain-containing protein [Planctomycetota bacterium]
MTETDEPTIACGIILYCSIDDERRFLLLRNARHQSWGFAKGHQDSGESLIKCAVREVHEETGYQLDPAGVFAEFNDCATYQPAVGTGLKRSIMFLARTEVPAEALQISNEHDKSAWCELNEALELLQHSQLQTCLLRASDYLDHFHEAASRP